jgi:hypothetical protein
MRITMEIKDNKFFYDYDINEGSHGGGNMPLCADSLTWFCRALQECHKLFLHQSGAEIDEMHALAYLEKHPEVAEKLRKLREKR